MGSVLRSEFRGEPGAWGSLAGAWPQTQVLLDPVFLVITPGRSQG